MKAKDILFRLTAAAAVFTPYYVAYRLDRQEYESLRRANPGKDIVRVPFLLNYGAFTYKVREPVEPQPVDAAPMPCQPR